MFFVVGFVPPSFEAVSCYIPRSPKCGSISTAGDLSYSGNFFIMIQASLYSYKLIPFHISDKKVSPPTKPNEYINIDDDWLKSFHKAGKPTKRPPSPTPPPPPVPEELSDDEDGVEDGSGSGMGQEDSKQPLVTPSKTKVNQTWIHWKKKLNCCHVIILSSV